MLSKQQKIDKINEKMADKTLSLGCRLSFPTTEHRFLDPNTMNYYKPAKFIGKSNIVGTIAYFDQKESHDYEGGYWELDSQEIHVYFEEYFVGGSAPKIWKWCWLNEKTTTGSMRLYGFDTYHQIGNYKQRNDDDIQSIMIRNGIEIIGHPVTIGDVLDWIERNIAGEVIHRTYRKSKVVYNYWKKYRKPIEDQSEECIDFIYSLIV